jgi:hypothetical protein
MNKMKIAGAFALILAFANLTGGVILLSSQDMEHSLLAKGPKAPPPPDPDHGPTLPPDPWEPI